MKIIVFILLNNWYDFQVVQETVLLLLYEDIRLTLCAVELLELKLILTNTNAQYCFSVTLFFCKKN